MPAPYTFGNSPRSGLRGDRITTVDFTLMKEFAIGERYRADFRGEAYNLLNTFGAADFGVVSSARSPRVMQLGLRLSF